MFTRNTGVLLAIAAWVLGGAVSGCEKAPDSEEFGEIIHQVPPELNKPFPLPELDQPKEGPQTEDDPDTGQEAGQEVTK